MSPIPQKYVIPTSSVFILFPYKLNHLLSSDLSDFGHEVFCEVTAKTCLLRWSNISNIAADCPLEKTGRTRLEILEQTPNHR